MDTILSVPTILRVAGYRLFFYSNERNEPPHVHVESAGNAAKFWLDPVGLAQNYGYDAREARTLQRLVEEHADELRRGWDSVHGHH
jgi:Domain of unknown function (DUF4160)